MTMMRAGAALAAAAMIASCAPRQAPPAPTPPPRHAPPPAPRASPPPEPPADWRDRALSPGDWRYSDQGSAVEATFASAGEALLSLRCAPGRRIILLRPAASAGQITIVTSFGERLLPGAGNADQATATLAASDPLFDQIVFSRGRFLVRAPAAGDLVVPSWPEPARVIEECRG